MTLLTRPIITWFLFIHIAITNGIVREKLYKPFAGDLFSHQISTVIAAAAYISLSYFMLRNHVATATNAQLFGIGLMWVLMTIAFEFGFGHYIDKVPWERLLADYNIFKGHVWGLFLLVIFYTPYIVKTLKNMG